MSTGNIGREPYTVSWAVAARSIEVVTMPDVTSIVFVVLVTMAARLGLRSAPKADSHPGINSFFQSARK
jgi:hypothetical protein